jgi:hypothetical protein
VDLFADDLAEGVFELGGFAFDVLAEGFVDERLAAGSSAVASASLRKWSIKSSSKRTVSP